mgnify:CR=1 FL=1
MTIPFQSVGLLPDGSQPGPIGASPADEAQAAPIHELRGKSSQRAASLAGKDTSLAGRPASFLSDDPCLSAQRAMGIC